MQRYSFCVAKLFILIVFIYFFRSMATKISVFDFEKKKSNSNKKDGHSKFRQNNNNKTVQEFFSFSEEN